MVPEAGGSSSFACWAFMSRELRRRLGADARRHRHRRDQRLLRAQLPRRVLAGLKTQPYNSIGGIVTIVFLVVINVVGIKEAARLNIILARWDLATQVLLMVVGVVLLLAPRLLIDQIHLGVAPTWTQLIYGVSIGTIAYTGIETVSNMAEEGVHLICTRSCAINYVLVAVLVVYLGISMTALSAMPVKANVLPIDASTEKTARVAVVVKSKEEPNGPFLFKGAPPPGHQGLHVYVLAVQKEDGGWVMAPEKPGSEVFVRDGQRYTKVYGSLLGSVYKEDPVVGIVRYLPTNVDWLKAILMPWVVNPGGHHPVDRHQCRSDRRVQARLFTRAAPAGAADPRPRAPEAHDAVRRHHRLRGGRLRRLCRRATRSSCSPTCTPSAP